MAGKNCDDALDRLYEFIDKELPDEDLHRIDEHLHKCSPCKSEMELRVKIKELVHSHTREKAPEELRHRILTAINDARDSQ